jgi:hypothetical protein
MTATPPHHQVGFKVKGSSDLRASDKKLMDHIEQHFVVSRDVDWASVLGPLADTSHEQRVIQAYHEDRLELKQQGKDRPAKMCIECAATGHALRYCPAKLENFAPSNKASK